MRIRIDSRGFPCEGLRALFLGCSLSSILWLSEILAHIVRHFDLVAQRKLFPIKRCLPVQAYGSFRLLRLVICVSSSLDNLDWLRHWASRAFHLQCETLREPRWKGGKLHFFEPFDLCQDLQGERVFLSTILPR